MEYDEEQSAVTYHSDKPAGPTSVTPGGLAALRESRAALLGVWRWLKPVLKEKQA